MGRMFALLRMTQLAGEPGYIACKCRSHFPQILAIGAGGEPSARGVRDFYFVYCSSSFVPSTAFFLVTHVHGILLTW